MEAGVGDEVGRKCCCCGGLVWYKIIKVWIS